MFVKRKGQFIVYGPKQLFFNDLTHTVGKVVVMLQTDCNVINLLLLTGLFQTWLKNRS